MPCSRYEDQQTRRFRIMTISSSFEDPFPEIRFSEGNPINAANDPIANQPTYHPYDINFNDDDNHHQELLAENHHQSQLNEADNLNSSGSENNEDISDILNVSTQSSSSIGENQSVVIEIANYSKKQQAGYSDKLLHNQVRSKELIDQYKNLSEITRLGSSKREQNKKNVTSNDKINSQESENQSHETKSNESVSENLTLTKVIAPSFKQTGYIRDKLFNGSSFIGSQNSKKDKYNVKVDILDVNHEDSYLCGYLCINHLTKNHPSLTTFFEGEIISERYPFLTKKWSANAAIDLDHWSKFDHFNENCRENYNSDEFDYEKLRKSDFIYMRWKERFLVPDHTIQHVEGASYAGFYYICYSKRTSTINGYYFHINSNHFESYQSLNLQLDEVNSSGVFQFR